MDINWIVLGKPPTPELCAMSKYEALDFLFTVSTQISQSYGSEEWL